MYVRVYIYTYTYIDTHFFSLSLQYIHYHCLIHDTCAKIEFQIQILHSCHSSNVNNVYTVSVRKINHFYFSAFSRKNVCGYNGTLEGHEFIVQLLFHAKLFNEVLL